jgi:hypothetical protein
MKHFLYHLFGFHVFELKGNCPSNYVLACKCGAFKALTPKQIGEIEDRKQIARIIEEYRDKTYQAFWGEHGQWRVVYDNGTHTMLMTKDTASNYALLFKSIGIGRANKDGTCTVILTEELTKPDKNEKKEKKVAET